MIGKRNAGISPGMYWSNLIHRTGTGVKAKAIENRAVQSIIAKKWVLLLLLMGFLLGRATILDQLAPFSMAFFAVIYFQKRDMLPWAALSLVTGSVLSLHPHTSSIVASMLIFLLIQKGIERFERSDVSYAPAIVFLSTFLVQLFRCLVNTDLSWYSVMMAGVEGILSLVLTLIFMQAVPVFTLTRKNYQLKNEEIICLIILLASVMTGTVGWLFGGVTVEHIISRYLILVFALVGGAPLGASVGVITGLILSLANVNAVYQMSLLAFSGMLAGLLKEGKRMAVGFGMFLGTSILSVYMGSQAEVFNSTLESLVAVTLFLLTPKSLVKTLSKYVPGTQEHVKSQQDYAKKVRDVTAGRVRQFSDVFQQLSQSFKQVTAEKTKDNQEDQMSHFIEAVSQKTCITCRKQASCWEKNFYQTYEYMTGMMTEIELNPNFQKKQILREWKQHCHKTEQVLNIMKQQYDLYQNNLRWKQQIAESRQLVADQLSGVSQIMNDLAKEIQREAQELFIQEEQIRSALEQLGLSIHSIEIISLDEGNVEIEVVHQYTHGYDECRKIIAPMLSEILDEHIAVISEEKLPRSEGLATVIFGSAKEYEVETGIASAAKGGDLLSGDSFSTVELSNGKFAVALSDGMGNGERARAESSTALSILQQLLQSGMDEKLAIKSVNSVLLLRSPEEMYATVDMALIDLYSAETTFIKIGSIPSFIKRCGQVIPISANNLPVGIIQDIDIDLVSVQLQPGDTLIMMTDGVYDAPGHTVNKEVWMKRVIHELQAKTPQEIADALLDQVMKYHRGDVHDDMTVVVARVEKYRPEWGTFRWPGLHRMERPKVVS